MARTFVIGDIHGCYKALMQCLERVNFDYEKDNLIQLGDIVDGWPDVYECVEELLKINNLISIRGNHDEWFQAFLEQDKHGSNWQQGAENTLKSYLKHANKEEYYDMIKWGHEYLFKISDIPESHIEFFKNQKNYVKVEDILFVHGGFNRHYTLKEQFPYIFYWDRDLWSQALSWQAMDEESRKEHPFKTKENFKEIFIGHTSTKFWKKDTPMNAAMIWNLDTGAGWDGKLTIMDISTKEFWQSDPVRELYPDEKGRNKK